MPYPKLSARKRGYDRDWERLRAFHLAGSPFCVYCQERDGVLKVANVVDHIKKFRDDWSLRLDPNNLQSLCKRCHDSRKQAEERREGKPETGLDGWPIA
jgi:5-methylcytosine-specific restriction endonuclease McrA